MKLKWVVEFAVDSTWLEDGFDLTKERALNMLANDLQFANIGTELKARIVSAPSKTKIRALQGYK